MCFILATCLLYGLKTLAVTESLRFTDIFSSFYKYVSAFSNIHKFISQPLTSYMNIEVLLHYSGPPFLISVIDFLSLLIGTIFSCLLPSFLCSFLFFHISIDCFLAHVVISRLLNYILISAYSSLFILFSFIISYLCSFFLVSYNYL